jgi:hypothetical protein
MKNQSKNALTQDIIRELLEYDPDTGVFIWKKRDRKWFTRDRDHIAWNTNHSGKRTGLCKSHGYSKVRIFDRLYGAHQIAFMYSVGYIPDEIDHIDHDRANNKWCNLREVNRSENNKNLSKAKNNTSGVTGVNFYKYKTTMKWRAYITIDGQQNHLGLFDDFQDAVTARKEAENKYRFHENHGADKK